ncbi:hypothetical protein BOX15_Mlig022939g3, partial [Macrostomum lignano]
MWITAPPNCRAMQSSTGRAPPTIDVLPSELLMQVLQHLTVPTRLVCAQVCRRWADVVRAPVLWERLPVTATALDDYSTAARLMTLATAAKELDLGTVFEPPSAIAIDRAATLLLRCGELRTLRLLDMGQYTGGPNLLTVAGRSCLQLRELSLAECPGIFNPEALASLSDGCPRLEKLELLTDGEEIFGGDVAQCAAPFCRLLGRIQVLHVRADMLATSAGPVAAAIATGWCRFTRLREVTLDPPASPSPARATRVLLDIISGQGDQLQRLTVHSQVVTDAIAGQIAARVGLKGANLRHLHLDAGDKLTVWGLRQLLKCWPGLQSLSLVHCLSLGAEGFRLACQELPDLTRLRYQIAASPDAPAGSADVFRGTRLPPSLRVLQLYVTPTDE